eukprot:TRINITY_DN27909_c0_g1_i1.p2 TRINITY_DN27909_c0_g1~~TRINITY_DN27909_c0_g1_i1.p2  ORF type:complete len:187 (+),score=63.02 TRINITY_DN27909_c0_g1_i1:67-627(+)
MALRSTAARLAGNTSKGLTNTRYYESGKGPVDTGVELWGLTEDKDLVPAMKGSMLWRKLMKQFPRMYKWERPDQPPHLAKFHRPGVDWGRTRYRFLTLDDGEWPKITLKSEEMLMKSHEEWINTKRLQLEGNFFSLRQHTYAIVPYNCGIIERHERALKYTLWLKEKHRNVEKHHPPPEKLLDFEL